MTRDILPNRLPGIQSSTKMSRQKNRLIKEMFPWRSFQEWLHCLSLSWDFTKNNYKKLGTTFIFQDIVQGGHYTVEAAFYL